MSIVKKAKATIRPLRYFIVSLSLKLFIKSCALLKIDAGFIYAKYISDKNLLNKSLFGDENGRHNIYSTYSSYLPDRYSEKLSLYKQQVNFFEYEDLNNWIAGNFKNNIGDIGRFFFLNLCLDYLLEDNIHGNVAELGVYKGNSAFLLAKYAARVHKTCYLFDTFEGFDNRDINGRDATVKQMFTDTSVEYVKKNVGYDEHVLYVKGYFPESLGNVAEPHSFSAVHIDCDLEKPFTDALNYFYPKMIKGGFIIMHDHSSLSWPGAKNAIDTFFMDKPEFIIPVPDKSGTCVIRKV